MSDLGTRDLMIGYYKRLLAGQGRTEALRNTQLEMLRSGLQSGSDANRLLVRKGQTNSTNSSKKDRSHPYYWASFIQSGEWASLDGKR